MSDFDPVLATLKIVEPEEIERDAKAQRGAEAREILGRLPLFLRAAPATELAGRIKCEPMRAAGKQWSPDQGSLVLIGPSSAGKTTAAGYLFRRLLAVGVVTGGEAWQRARSLRWFSATEIEIARREHPLGHGDAPEVTQARFASVLFLDDLGWERDVRTVAEVLNERYELGRVTVVTSGKTRAELSEQYGGAVIRRVGETGGNRATVISAFPAAAKPGAA